MNRPSVRFGLPIVHHLLHGEGRDPTQHGLAKGTAEQISLGPTRLSACPTTAEHAAKPPQQTAERIVAPLLPILRELPGHGPRVVVIIVTYLRAALLPQPASQLAPLLAREAAEGVGGGFLVLLR